MHVSGVGAEGRIGAGGEVFFSMQFLASIDHGGGRRRSRHEALLPAFEHTTINENTRQQVSIIKIKKKLSLIMFIS